MFSAFPKICRDEDYVLVIEDSQIDFELITRTFKRINFNPEILHWDNGAGALDFLLNLADKNNVNGMPTLVLLDLNLPGIDGRDILSTIKGNKRLQHIPVIVLSTSQSEKDIQFCQHHGADKYLSKPASYDDFPDVAKTIKEFWGGLVCS